MSKHGALSGHASGYILETASNISVDASSPHPNSTSALTASLTAAAASRGYFLRTRMQEPPETEIITNAELIKSGDLQLGKLTLNRTSLNVFYKTSLNVTDRLTIRLAILHKNRQYLSLDP